MSTGTFSVSGLMSGIDTESMITQLEESMRGPVEKLETQIEDYSVKLSLYSTLQAKLTTFSSAAEALDTEDEFFSITASSSDTDYITATGSSDAVKGTYEIEVEQLARAHKVKSSAFTSDEVIGTGTITIQVGANEAVDVTITDDEDTIQEIATKINNTDGIDVAANAVYDGENYYLVLTAQETGDDNIINISVDDDDNDDTDTSGLSQLANNNFQTQSFSSDQTFGAGSIILNGTYTITVNQDDTLEDIAKTINTYDWGTDDPVGKAVVVTDSDGNEFLRVAGVETWEPQDDHLSMFNGTTKTKTGRDSTAIITTQDVSLRINNTYTISLQNKTLAEVKDEINSLSNSISAELVGAAGNEFLQVTGITSWESDSDVLPAWNVATGKNMTESQIGQDSKIILDNDESMPIYRSSNSVADVITGVTLNLKKLTTSEVQISVAQSSSDITEKVEAFVNAYNDIYDFITEQQAAVEDEDETTKTLEESVQDLIKILAGEELEEDEDEYGPLQGDATSNLIKSTLARSFSYNVSGVDSNYDSLSDIGITFYYGRMVLDTEDLETAVNANPEEVVKLFTQDTEGAEGIAVKAIDVVDSMIEKYKSDAKGSLIIAQESLTTNIENAEDRIETLENHIEDELDIFRSQMNALETIMGEYQTTSTYIASMLTSSS